VRARRAGPPLARQVRTRGRLSSQLPDLSKLNSVSGPRASRPAAGSTPTALANKHGDSTEQTTQKTEVIHRRFH
jgi:hypothetical protein